MSIKRFFQVVAATLLATTVFSCQPIQGTFDKLEVVPSSPLQFKATGNEDVTLKVTADLEWKATCSASWVVIAQKENVLTVNVQDNETDGVRSARIQFVSGNNTKYVLVSQDPAIVDEGIYSGHLTVEAEADVHILPISVQEGTEVKAMVYLTLDEAPIADQTVELVLEGAEYLDEFNFVNDETAEEMFPVANIDAPKTITVVAGETTAAVEVVLSLEGVDFAKEYLLAFTAQNTENVKFVPESKRVNFTVTRTLPKEVKNCLYFEVNDVNPLNALEFLLADGTPFFDCVVLFAANINYNRDEDVVFLSNNKNVQALLDETEVYLQPLRRKGIKVQLGLLGNHDESGLCQLSDWGCEQWAQEVAEACAQYKLDGVNLDDEWSNSPDLSNHWFASPSARQGSKLAYELKTRLAKECSWPTEVSVFRYGNLTSLTEIDGHKPGEFVDFWMGNYGSSTSEAAGMTKKQCCRMSLDLAAGLGGSLSEAQARQAVIDGYGWVMWYALAPSNFNNSLNKIRPVCKGLYEQELRPVEYEYRKITEGKYDPTRYKRN